SSANVVTNQPQAHSGFWCAWLGGYGVANTDTLSQTVDIPTGTSGTLAFWLQISTAEVQDKVFDTLKVQIADENGVVLQTLHTFSNRAAHDLYERVHFDVTPFLGRRVRVQLVATEDNGKATSFFVDDVTLTVQH